MRYVENDQEPPPPAEIPAPDRPATADEAARILRATDDFGLLQAMSRAIGQRLEALQGPAQA